MSKNTLKPKDYEKIGRALEDIYISGHKDIKRLLWFNFIRGIAYGFGIFLAGTIVVAILMWFLGLFEQMPMIGPFIQKIIDSLR